MWVCCCWVPKRDDAGWSENCMPRCNALKNGHLPERKGWDLYRRVSELLLSPKEGWRRMKWKLYVKEWTDFYMIGASVMKKWRRPSTIILRKSVLTCCKAEFTFFVVFFCLGFLTRIFTIHRRAREEGGYLLISFLPLSLVSQRLRH